MKLKEIRTRKSDWKDAYSKAKQEVTEEEIADIVASWTGIPVRKLAEEESERLRKLEEILHKRVIGKKKQLKLFQKL